MSAPLTLAAPAAFAPAVTALAEGFSRATAVPVTTLFGPAGGDAPGSVVSRLQSSNPPDLALLPAALFDRQVEAGTLVAALRVEAARSPVALCVRAGATRPDVSTEEVLIRTLRAAPSIGISALASGVFFRETLLARLELAEEVGPRCQVITGRPIAAAVAEGAVALGVHQWAELLQEEGIDILDPLPAGLQGATLLCAGASATGAGRTEAETFLHYLKGPEANAALHAHGLLPALAPVG